MLFKSEIFCYNKKVLRERPCEEGFPAVIYGVWRSLVARSAGGREVAGSNPVTPTKKPLNSSVDSRVFLFLPLVYIKPFSNTLLTLFLGEPGRDPGGQLTLFRQLFLTGKAVEFLSHSRPDTAFGVIFHPHIYLQGLL